MARTKVTPNPPPRVDYKALYRWAPDDLLAKTSQVTSFKSIDPYKESEFDEKFRIFGRDNNLYVKVLPCREGEPVCVDDRADLEKPFFFMYSTIFKQIKLRAPN